jgi:hypothetical protein
LLFLVSGLLVHKPSLQAVILQDREEKDALPEADVEGEDVDDSRSIASAASIVPSFLLGPFDAAKREPEFALHGGLPSLWELALLRCHFHPSVRAFTDSLLGAPDREIAFEGDPIASFSIMVRCYL